MRQHCAYRHGTVSKIYGWWERTGCREVFSVNPWHCAPSCECITSIKIDNGKKVKISKSLRYFAKLFVRKTQHLDCLILTLCCFWLRIFLKFILLKDSWFVMCVNFHYTAEWCSYAHMYIPFHILFCYGSSQNMEHRSLCCTAGPCLSSLCLLTPASHSIPPPSFLPLGILSWVLPGWWKSTGVQVDTWKELTPFPRLPVHDHPMHTQREPASFSQT